MKTLLLLSFLTSALQASIVVWTANGTVNSVTGVYQALVPADVPVNVEMRYDDQAGRDVPRDLSGLGFPIKDLDYRQAIDLEISVSIGSDTWRGTVSTGSSGQPYTLFLKLNGTDGGAESITGTVHESDGASFDSFPLESQPDDTLIQLVFNSSDNSFLTDDIQVSSFKPEVITSASGFFQSGASNKVSFSLDPASVTITTESPVPPTPVLSLERTNDNLAISWQSEFEVNYQLQFSLTMEEGSWTNTGNLLIGNAGTLTQNVAIAPGFNIFYRVIATPAPEL